ncbi:hypothetical protein DFP93_10723 [Aneurinibacillus soli]|uniref:Uncharacterized protein n=1 Tax=Aneurinibacillus soli TaxID=1500254 RepID=A0A0U5BC61_9BACL|nr:hypothetical protein [Aneurinibacillus soli]PYE61634.1 hypothetical protein DFP93_10723 [Aneurinibacillus soli]BAU28508.1 hypothetical protein CB4_02682 [Aneurinibacillus soli]
MKVSMDSRTLSALLSPQKNEKERVTEIQKRIEEIDKEIEAIRKNSSINPKQKVRMISQLYMEKIKLMEELRRKKDSSDQKERKMEHPHAKPIRERQIADDPNKPIAIDFQA